MAANDVQRESPAVMREAYDSTLIGAGSAGRRLAAGLTKRAPTCSYRQSRRPHENGGDGSVLGPRCLEGDLRRSILAGQALARAWRDLALSRRP
jgi:hypothetical protein